MFWVVSSELLDGYYSILGCCILVKVKSLKQHFYVVVRVSWVVARELLDGYYSILGCCLLVKVKSLK